MSEYTHTIPSGSRIVVVVSTGPLDEDFRTKMENDNILMPDVLGKSQGTALEELAEINFKPRVIYDYNDDIMKGAVMDQHPVAGVLASPELESLLLVSSGPSINERVQVNLPDVTGLDEEVATTKLKDAGLSPQIVRYKSSSVEKGKVSAQIPDAASLAAQPEVRSKVAWVIIAVIIAALLALGYFAIARMDLTPPPPAGEVVTQMAVPNLIGLTEEEAERELIRIGFALGTVTVADADLTPYGAVPGTVIKTSPAAGDEVAAGSPIALTLAADSHADEIYTVIVPELLGLDEDGVHESFEDVDLVFSIVSSPDLEVPEGEVALQSPSGGTEVLEGSVVVVVISTGEPSEVIQFN
ncbi:MAG: PASTA domain-containing protein, partial [Coriobacteriia bacterium]|nr:PASTA domain-containing protein [Coriobacteriia bacterium]